jgi:formamidopyrimidine-DNA glycosylase
VPELPEVEVVRRGLERWVAGRRIEDVHLHHPRATRRHGAGPVDFVARLRGATLNRPARRGKYLWLPASARDAEFAMIAHLGMSGQLLVVDAGSAPEKHLRVGFSFADGGRDLRFVDQRTFGGLFLDDIDEDGTPALLRHIARDPIDPAFDEDAWIDAVRRRRTGIKRALLDQTLVSGIGNIYADEALWRTQLHGERPTAALTRPMLRRLMANIRDVLAEALAQGGTSFDSLYVNVNGESGYFDRSLDAYGREGLPCRRCGAPMRREQFMNRSSTSCPRCQPRPRVNPSGVARAARSAGRAAAAG